MRKHISQTLVEGNARLDFKLEIELRKIKHFSINVALISENGSEDVFRVDTAHERLHTQKFWISPEPAWLEDEGKGDYLQDFLYWKKEVLENFERWIELFRKKKGGLE